MRYFPYPWKEGELENILKENINCPCHKDERFVGPLLPFLGGVLLGGLFLPRPVPVSPYGPIYQPVPYAQPVPYVTEVPTYSAPVTNAIKK